MRVREFFGMERGEQESECVLVIEYMRKKAGIIVDSPLGEYQTVIKPLGPVFRELSWANGATILGTGEVALILDVPRLIKSGQFTGLSSVV
jgi:two-component system chemotaxis sensor kinase CheA